MNQQNAVNAGFLSVAAFLVLSYALFDVMNLYYDTFEYTERYLNTELSIDRHKYLITNIRGSYWNMVDKSYGSIYGHHFLFNEQRIPNFVELFRRQRFYDRCSDNEIKRTVVNATKRNLAKWVNRTKDMVSLEHKELNSFFINGTEVPLEAMIELFTFRYIFDNECEALGCCDITVPYALDPTSSSITDINNHTDYSGGDYCSDNWPNCPDIYNKANGTDFCLAVTPCEVYDDAKKIAQYYRSFDYAGSALVGKALFPELSTCGNCLSNSSGISSTSELFYPYCPTEIAQNESCGKFEAKASNLGLGAAVQFMSKCPVGKWHSITLGHSAMDSCEFNDSANSRTQPYRDTLYNEDLYTIGSVLGNNTLTDAQLWNFNESYYADPEIMESLRCSGYTVFDACSEKGLLETVLHQGEGKHCCYCQLAAKRFTSFKVCLPCEQSVDDPVLDILSNTTYIGTDKQWNNKRISYFEGEQDDNIGLEVKKTCEYTRNYCRSFNFQVSQRPELKFSLTDPSMNLTINFTVQGEIQKRDTSMLSTLRWNAYDTVCRLWAGLDSLVDKTKETFQLELGTNYMNVTVESSVINNITHINFYSSGGQAIQAYEFAPPAFLAKLKYALTRNDYTFVYDKENYYFQRNVCAGTCHRIVKTVQAGRPLGITTTTAQSTLKNRFFDIVPDGNTCQWSGSRSDVLSSNPAHCGPAIGQYNADLISLLQETEGNLGQIEQIIGNATAKTLLDKAVSCQMDSPVKDMCLNYFIRIHSGPLHEWEKSRGGYPYVYQ